MKAIENKIKEIAARLLQSGEVNIFLAWEKGDYEYQSKPYFARSVDEVDKIVFDQYCIHNLSNSLLKFRDSSDKIGLVVKGCDSRGYSKTAAGQSNRAQPSLYRRRSLPGYERPPAGHEKPLRFIQSGNRAGSGCQMPDLPVSQSGHL